MSKILTFLTVAVMLVATAGFARAGTQILPGDFVVIGNPFQATDGSHIYLIHKQNMAREGGVYQPYFGDEFSTWDGGTIPLNRAFVWTHIEIAGQYGEVVSNGDWSSRISWGGAASTPYQGRTVILRLKDWVSDWLCDRNKLAEVRNELTIQNYAIPTLYVEMRFLRAQLLSGTDWINWTIRSHWMTIHGIDIYRYQNSAQWSPGVGTSAHWDIDHPSFKARDMNCSTWTWWCFVYAVEEKCGGQRDIFLNSHESVNAVDCLAPGGVAWWLHEYTLVDIIS